MGKRRADPGWLAGTRSLISTLPRGGLSPCLKYKEETAVLGYRVKATTSLGTFETLRDSRGSIYIATYFDLHAFI